MSTTLTSPSENRTSSEANSTARDANASSQKLIRICHLSMTLNTGGLERLLVDFARFHDREKYDLSFIALDQLGAPAEDLGALGHQVWSVDFRKHGKLGGLRRLRSLFRQEKFDILHTHNTYPHFYGTTASRLTGIRAIFNTQHGRGCGGSWKDLWQFRIANRRTRAIVGVSDDAVSLCQGQDPTRARKMLRIWNGIDLDRFQFTGPSDRPTAISVARLSPEKDFATLLRAVKLLIRDVPDFQLMMVGDGSERKHLQQLVKDLELQHYVQFLGERGDVPDLLPKAGFFVSSSKSEGVSLTLLEAMAVGLPIVTTSVGGNPEVVVDDVTGKLVPPMNPDALASAMREMVEEQALWPDMARAARERVDTYFNVKSMVQNYETLYSRYVKSPRK